MPQGTSWLGRWDLFLSPDMSALLVMFVRHAHNRTAYLGLAGPNRLPRLHQPRDGPLVGGLHQRVPFQGSCGWSVDCECLKTDGELYMTGCIWFVCTLTPHKEEPILWCSRTLQDMNEPASFVQGSSEGCPDGDLENPPYTPSKCVGSVLHVIST